MECARYGDYDAAHSTDPTSTIPFAARLPEETAFFTQMQELVWTLTQKMFSARLITPGVTRTSDVVWWMRQRVADYGLTTWFQPSVDVQRKGGTEGEDPVIQKGDVLHCDFGITAMRLNTDTQHMGYVLNDGETEVQRECGPRWAMRTGCRTSCSARSSPA